MSLEYYGFDALAKVEEKSLEIPRAIGLCRAVHFHRDTRLVQLLQMPKDAAGSVGLEVLVIDMDCEGVPSKNAVGIQYCERLALFITSDEKSVPQVFALRKDFPATMHQNQVLSPGPANPCVYFGPPAATLRTWTPAGFLRRIQWWLEKSARGELHPADQPVEHLFFESKYELVLPWNVDELSKSTAHRAVIFRSRIRPDNNLTYFLEFVEKQAKPEGPTVAHLEFTLPEIVHGFVERDPHTLGELSELLIKRGVDLVKQLGIALDERISPNGAKAAKDDDVTILLLSIPVVRKEGAAPEYVQRRAFGIANGSLQLGEALGTYMVLDGTYYRAKGVLEHPEPTRWRDIRVDPMEVLQRNTVEKARAQSGIGDEGPSGVLVGAGSLGSTMLGLWGRSGWGRWTVIDNDHIRPHNLSRHPALVQHIGNMKASVAAELHDFAMQGASEVKGICADACDFANAEVAKALESSQVVIDVSTTLEYPRLASTREGVPRHVSVFVTPDGNSSVLLAEDAERKQRLRTLEAQYYRAVINAEWGKNHLEGNLSHFWSGASCRDISLVMSYSGITAHAATLAEQVRLALKQPGGCIRIWQRDWKSGAVSSHVVPSCGELQMELGEFNFFVDDGLRKKLIALRARQLPSETGGILLGYYDFNVKAIVLVDALPAPADSKSSRAAFERGIVGLHDAISEATKRTAGIVQYVGEWHSHPPGHSARPSTDDSYQLVYLALHMAEEGMPAVQLIVGENEFVVRKANATT